MAKKFEEIKLNEDDETFRGKVKDPLIRTIMTGLNANENKEFGIRNWSELQELLKRNLSFAKNGIKWLSKKRLLIFVRNGE